MRSWENQTDNNALGLFKIQNKLRIKKKYRAVTQESALQLMVESVT